MTRQATRDLTPQNGLQGSSFIYNYGTSPNTRVAITQKIRLLAPAYGSTTNTLSQLGVVSSFNPSESKTINPIRGIGFGDQIAEMVPSVTEPTGGSVERACLYLANLWQATGYASGTDGPVRSLRHHRWPFDMEQQVVLSSLADQDLLAANVGVDNSNGNFGSGVRQVQYPSTGGGITSPNNAVAPYAGTPQGHSSIVTIYEACWWESWSSTYSVDTAQIMESGDLKATDVHDFSSRYGEFIPTGNDPTVGQLGSIRYSSGGGTISAGFTAGGAPTPTTAA